MVSVFVLTKNEQDSIGSLIEEIKGALKGLAHQIYVVDDSKDRTPIIARQMGCVVLPGEGQGLGQAYSKALKHLSFGDVITIDGDGQADPKEISEFIAQGRQEKVDLLLGSRFLEEDLVHYSYPKINRFGVFLLSSFLSFECGQRITDSHGGIRFHSEEAARKIQVLGRHTYVQESILSAHRQGLKIKERPSVWRKRMHGESRVVGCVRSYIWRVCPILIRKGQRSQILASFLLIVFLVGFVFNS